MQPSKSNSESAKISDETIAKTLRPLAPRKLSRLFFDSERPFYILDGKDRLRYANQTLLNELAIDEASLVGLDCSPSSSMNTGRSAELSAKLAIPTSSRRVGLDVSPMGQAEASSEAASKWPARLLVLLDSSFGNGSIGCWWLSSNDKIVKEFSKQRSWTHEKEILSAILAAKKPFARLDGLFCLIGSSPVSTLTRRQAKVAADLSISVLICGPPGAGKSTLAQTILHARHKKDSRQPSTAPILPIECRLVDRRLMTEMIELVQERSSPSSGSDSSTMLLKNIDQLPEEAHSVLAAYLKQNATRSFMATAGLGDLSAIHRQSSDWKAILSFVSTIKLDLPPLHHRPEDIAPTVTAVLEEIQSTKSPRDRKHFSPTTIRTLEGYVWPGEMREVVHALQSAIQKAPGDVIEPEHLTLAIRTFASHVLKPEPPREIQLERVLEAYERKIIAEAIRLFPRNRAAAARHLGISRTKLLRRLTDLKIDSEPETTQQVVEPPSAPPRRPSKGVVKSESESTKPVVPPKDSEGDAPVFIELAGDEHRND